jgi:hypothetical protein
MRTADRYRAIPLARRVRNQQPDDEDAPAYEKETGRSARDIAEENAAVRAQQESDVTSQEANSSG